MTASNRKRQTNALNARLQNYRDTLQLYRRVIVALYFFNGRFTHGRVLETVVPDSRNDDKSGLL